MVCSLQDISAKYDDLLYTEGQIRLLHTFIQLQNKKFVIKRNAPTSLETFSINTPFSVTIIQSQTEQQKQVEGRIPELPLQFATHSKSEAYTGAAQGMPLNACAVVQVYPHQRKLNQLCSVPVEFIQASNLGHYSLGISK